jgi:hypothetical protein
VRQIQGTVLDHHAIISCESPVLIERACVYATTWDTRDGKIASAIAEQEVLEGAPNKSAQSRIIADASSCFIAFLFRGVGGRERAG